jgi:hypothetical protein
MVAAQGEKVKGFLSVAGAGKPADQLIKEQFKNQPKSIQDTAYPNLDSLVAGEKVQNVPQVLNSLFRPSVQPYLISWFHYDPASEIKKLSVKSLIIQGTADLQVSVENAKLLCSNALKPDLILIEGMNHIFKNPGPGRQENLMTYSNPGIPVNEELIIYIAKFVSHR